MLLIPKRHGQTDRQTDGRLTVALPRSALASRGKNGMLKMPDMFGAVLQKCNVPFHIVGLKCIHCGSYNTCRDSEPEVAEQQSVKSTDAVQPEDAAADAVDKNVQD